MKLHMIVWQWNAGGFGLFHALCVHMSVPSVYIKRFCKYENFHCWTAFCLSLSCLSSEYWQYFNILYEGVDLQLTICACYSWGMALNVSIIASLCNIWDWKGMWDWGQGLIVLGHSTIASQWMMTKQATLQRLLLGDKYCLQQWRRRPRRLNTFFYGALLNVRPHCSVSS
jgi:hypothetical protein